MSRAWWKPLPILYMSKAAAQARRLIPVAELILTDWPLPWKMPSTALLKRA